jgi:large subunit ribosomal protein L25
MEMKTLSGLARPERKTNAARRLRHEGMIPAVIYGHNDPVAIAVNAKDFSRAFKVISESQLITLTVDGKEYEVLIKDYQEDIVTGAIEHIDFFEIEAGKTLRTHIAVTLDGTPAGVREGGILEQPLHGLDIECLPRDIPETVHIDISALGVGDSIHVSDIPVPEGVKILTSEEQTVALVALARMEIEEPETEEEELEGEEGVGGEEGADEESEEESEE